MTELPVYSGRGLPCPGCGTGLVLTEWHWAAHNAGQEVAGHQPPCAGRTNLLAFAGHGQHLCRVCLNCGYGWLEAAVEPGTVPTPATSPQAVSPGTAAAGLAVLGGALVSAGTDACLSVGLHGIALAIAQLVAAVVIGVAGAAGHAALVAPPPTGPALPRRRALPAARREARP